MSTSNINAIEQEIDEAFASNALAGVPWAQSAWTLLSVVEDHRFKITVMRPLPDREAAIYVDGLVNAMTYPLRVLRQRAPRVPTSLDRRYIEVHYGLARSGWTRQRTTRTSAASSPYVTPRRSTSE